MPLNMITVLRPDQLDVLAGEVEVIVGRGTRYGKAAFSVSDIENAGTNAEIAAEAATILASVPARVATFADLAGILPTEMSVGDYVAVLDQGDQLYQRVAAAPGYDYTGTGGCIFRTYPDTVRDKANGSRAINFFDFLTAAGFTPANIDAVAAGTYMSDLAAPWTAFRDALQAESTAGRKPHGIIPQCTIRTSVSPNFAMDFLRLDTDGLVEIIGTGTNAGIVFDGRDQGVNGYGNRRLKVGPIMASSTTGTVGYSVIWCHKSEFVGAQSRGGSSYGLQIMGCVTSVFINPVVSNQAVAWLQQPLACIYVSSAAGADLVQAYSSWCTLVNPVGEYGQNSCIQIDNAYGTVMVGGTAEGGRPSVGTGFGLVLGANCQFSKIYGQDVEFNKLPADSGLDVLCYGSDNDFFGVDTQEKLFFDSLASRNRVWGGTHKLIECAATTTYNLINGVTYATFTNGNATVTDENRIVNSMLTTGGWSP